MKVTKEQIQKAISIANKDKDLDCSITTEEFMSFKIAKDNYEEGLKGTVPSWLKPYVKSVVSGL